MPYLAPGKHTINWFTPPCPRGCVQSKMISATKFWWFFHPFADPFGTFHNTRYLQRTLSTRQWGENFNGPYDWSDSQSVTLDRLNGWPQWTGQTSYPRDAFAFLFVDPRLAPDFTFSVQPTEIVYEYHKTINGVTQNFRAQLNNTSPYTKDELESDVKGLLSTVGFEAVPWGQTLDLIWNIWDGLNPVDGIGTWPKLQGPGVGDDVWFPSADMARAFQPRPAPVVLRSFRDLAAPVAGSSFDYDQSVWSKNKSLSNSTGTHCVHTDIYDVNNGAHSETCATVDTSCTKPLLLVAPDYDLAVTTALQGFRAQSNGCPCVLL